jgi:ABC-2 type transport system ATP-binding protein
MEDDRGPGPQKHFGEVEALAGLDLAVPSGTVLAILGPNGAGKTTLIRTIATLTQPTAEPCASGSGRGPESAARRIGRGHGIRSP